MPPHLFLLTWWLHSPTGWQAMLSGGDPGVGTHLLTLYPPYTGAYSLTLVSDVVDKCCWLTQFHGYPHHPSHLGHSDSQVTMADEQDGYNVAIPTKDERGVL